MIGANLTVYKLLEIQAEIINNSSKEEDIKMHGIRDAGSLDYFIDRLNEDPDICNNPIKKVAFTLFFIPNNQIFKQANKRTSIAIADIILAYEGMMIESDTPEFKEFMLDATDGKYNLKEVEDWVNKRVKKN